MGREYTPSSGYFIGADGRAKNIMDALDATPISDRVYDVDSFSPNNGVFLNSKGEECDLASAVSGMADKVSSLEPITTDKINELWEGAE